MDAADVAPKEGRKKKLRGQAAQHVKFTKFMGFANGFKMYKQPKPKVHPVAYQDSCTSPRRYPLQILTSDSEV